MSAYLNYYGRNAEVGEPYQTLWGYTYLGPILIPPVPTTFGMEDRNPDGDGTIWFLMWDGEDHLLLTDDPPIPFAQCQGSNWGVTEPYGQNVAVFGPWDGPYMGVTGWRLGVTTEAITVGGTPYAGGQPRLQFDSPDDAAHGGYTASGPPIIAPNFFGQQTQSYPEPSNYPAPGVPTIPGIPSSTPLPTSGGLAAFIAAYQTNTPPLILPASPFATGLLRWHLQHLGA